MYKKRREPLELALLKSLNSRMELSDELKTKYLNQGKGWEGERKFDKYLKDLAPNSIILNDLLLQSHQTTFQIDSLLIEGDALHLYEIKNYEGDFYYENDRFYKKKNKVEISNPITQLKRTDSLLRQLVHQLGYSITIIPHVVFINPEFILYQAPLHLPCIYPNQLNRYVKLLEKNKSQVKKQHAVFAEKLIALHMDESPYRRIPSYTYEELKKGILCDKCNSLFISTESAMIKCDVCGYTESLELAVLRSVKEFKLLFPERKITTKEIHDWCLISGGMRRIKRILDKHYRLIGVHQWAYYE
ncbi:nuclease-related domain-containing protein [Niallia sp. FSL R7-0648]|uniref:nuclease-related domain-containing protein n=1 Tax=Niallia sp. FSL R7-0648 TaxID=2954521 RepID=UPI0030FB20B9